MIKFRYPNITGRTEADKIRKMESYLRQLVDQLNMALSMLEQQNKERKG